jgi:hypothetical protein
MRTGQQEHPLLLLQAYSNAEKYQSMALAHGLTLFRFSDQPFWLSTPDDARVDEARSSRPRSSISPRS